MGKTYHILDKEQVHAAKDYFDPKYGSHFIELPNGRVLLAAHFETDWGEEMFHSTATNKIDLPHPVYQGNQPLTKEHLRHIGHLVKGIDIPTVHDVVRSAAKLHPLMRLSPFHYPDSTPPTPMDTEEPTTSWWSKLTSRS